MSLESVFFYIVLILFYVICLFLILVILGQEGKGGGLSGMMGTSALGETFGFGGAAATLRRWTRNAALAFLGLALVITFWGSRMRRDATSEFLKGADTAAATLPPGLNENLPPTGNTPAPGRSATTTARPPAAATPAAEKPAAATPAQPVAATPAAAKPAATTPAPAAATPVK